MLIQRGHERFEGRTEHAAKTTRLAYRAPFVFSETLDESKVVLRSANHVAHADGLRLTAKPNAAAAAAREAEITAAIDGATAAGKIAPASRDYHLASCRAEGGLDRFRAMIAASPVIAGGTAPKAQATPGKAGLSDEELAVCRHLGMTPDAFAAAKAAEQE